MKPDDKINKNTGKKRGRREKSRKSDCGDEIRADQKGYKKNSNNSNEKLRYNDP